MHHAIPTQVMLQKKGISTPSRCGVCLNACESAEHLFISCSFAQLIWRWLFDCFEIHKAIPSSISELWDFINNRK